MNEYNQLNFIYIIFNYKITFEFFKIMLFIDSKKQLIK